jgi:hypothetical protein
MQYYAELRIITPTVCGYWSKHIFWPAILRQTLLYSRIQNHHSCYYIFIYVSQLRTPTHDWLHPPPWLTQLRPTLHVPGARRRDATSYVINDVMSRVPASAPSCPLSSRAVMSFDSCVVQQCRGNWRGHEDYDPGVMAETWRKRTQRSRYFENWNMITNGARNLLKTVSLISNIITTVDCLNLWMSSVDMIMEIKGHWHTRLPWTWTQHDCPKRRCTY